MIPLRPSEGIGPHVTFMEDGVLHTTLTLAGGLFGTKSEGQTASYMIMNQSKFAIKRHATCGKYGKIRAVHKVVD